MFPFRWVNPNRENGCYMYLTFATEEIFSKMTGYLYLPAVHEIFSCFISLPTLDIMFILLILDILIVVQWFHRWNLCFIND